MNGGRAGSERPPEGVAVLALQGGFEAHGAALRRMGADCFEARRPDDLDRAAGLVIPGGESTTLWKFVESGAWEDTTGDVRAACGAGDLRRLDAPRSTGHDPSQKDSDPRCASSARYGRQVYLFLGPSRPLARNAACDVPSRSAIRYAPS